MKPKDAYDDTAERAKRFLRLHDGLINNRQRGIRADWKQNFCKLMHWNKGCQIERIDSKDAIVVLRDGAELNSQDFTQESMDDLLRGALTFGVSALDRYVHERVVKSIVAALKKNKLSKEQEEFSIPVRVAISITESISKSRKEQGNLPSPKLIRPANEIRKKIQEMLHKRPFQSWKEIEYAFKLIGISGLAGKLQSAYSVGDIGPIKNQLNKIVERRNYIVHEGDLVRHERGGTIKMQAITRKYVEDSLNFLDDLVSKLETIDS